MARFWQRLLGRFFTQHSAPRGVTLPPPPWATSPATFNLRPECQFCQREVMTYVCMPDENKSGLVTMLMLQRLMNFGSEWRFCHKCNRVLCQHCAFLVHGPGYSLRGWECPDCYLNTAHSPLTWYTGGPDPTYSPLVRDYVAEALKLQREHEHPVIQTPR